MWDYGGEYEYYENEENLSQIEEDGFSVQRLPARPKVEYLERHEIYENGEVYFSEEETSEIEDENDVDSIQLEPHEVKSRRMSTPMTKKIIEPTGPRWTTGYIENFGKTPAKWGAPRFEEIEFPWNKPGTL